MLTHGVDLFHFKCRINYGVNATKSKERFTYDRAVYTLEHETQSYQQVDSCKLHVCQSLWNPKRALQLCIMEVRIIVETQFCFNFCNSLIAVIAIGPRVELPVGVCMEEI